MISKRHLRIVFNIFVSIMDARCVNCNKRADYNIEKNKIKCQNCGLEIDYDEYLEQMKEKATNLADNFQSSWDKTGF